MVSKEESRFIRLLLKARNIEEKAILSYLGWANTIGKLGLLRKPYSDFMVSIIADSILHKNLVEAILKSLSEIRDVREYINSIGSESLIRVDEDVKEMLLRAIKEHEEIEKDAAATYRKLAKASKNELMRAVFEAIAKDEGRHEKYVRDLSVLSK